MLTRQQIVSLTALLLISAVAAVCPAQSLSVSPSQFRIGRPRDQIQLSVQLNAAHPVDVTRKTKYSTTSPDVVTVSDTGVVRAVGNGKAVISAKYGTMTADCSISATGFSSPQAVSFEHETLPVLSKNGCSGGSCHGAPHGKAGFRLSLFGGDPEADRSALVREAHSRRVSPLSAENSLLLLKPTMQVPHMGGRRFSRESGAYRILQSWISEGCSVQAEEIQCTGIEVQPGIHHVLRLPESDLQFRVTASFSDGSVRDVTHLARFESSNSALAEVSKDGFVSGLARGDVAVIVRYLHFTDTPLLTFVRDVNEFEWTQLVQQNYIDKHVDAKLQQMQFLPSPLCSDEVFLRRVFLDVVGILPTPQERHRFLADQSADKRARLISELLERPEYPKFWAQKWGDLLRLSRKQIGLTSVFKFSSWLQAAIAENRPYDQLARQLLTASGSTLKNPAGNYYRTSADTNDAMETSAQLFLGTRIQCAKCHNHPFERWTQDNYYGLAAVFHRVGRKKTQHPEETVVFPTADGDVSHPATGQPAMPWVPTSGLLNVQAGQDRRAAFADWLTSEQNPFFAAVEVNRIWAQVMGTGIVEPFDDFRDSNPPSNPELLNALAKDFRDNRYDRNHILRTILNSRTYQSASVVNRFNRADTRYFSHYRARRLSAEQLVDALTSVIDVPEHFVAVPSGTKATWLPAPDLKPHDRADLGSVDFLKVFGQPERQSVCECERGDETSLGQALQLLNGEFLHKRLSSESNRFRRLLKEGKAPAVIVQDLYIRALGREPVEQELTAAITYLANAIDRGIALEDVCWVIVNDSEFLFQH